MSILNVEHLSHGFGDRAIFEDVSLTVCTDKPYVLALQQSEGNILKNSTVAKTMA